ncbi:hypothetical protein [Mycobacterium sp. DL99]|uniref:hypothetical protein n=1 Tax=Mycobacterium sp. DL99 TaxID=2528957 RepID=UPI00143673C0|nr:hypothetical protein [Mycobacterium sp. DL99]
MLSLNVIANYDRSIVPYLLAPPGVCADLVAWLPLQALAALEGSDAPLSAVDAKR